VHISPSPVTSAPRVASCVALHGIDGYKNSQPHLFYRLIKVYLNALLLFT
jgi:hypothetical protein